MESEGTFRLAIVVEGVSPEVVMLFRRTDPHPSSGLLTVKSLYVMSSGLATVTPAWAGPAACLPYVARCGQTAGQEGTTAE